MLVAASIGGLTYNAWVGLIPAPRDLTVSLWTAAFAAIGAVALRDILSQEHEEGGLLLDEAREAVGVCLWRYTAQMAESHGSDVNLMHAIVGAEAIQRPGWFRRIERVKGRVFPSGTYGVAQVYANHPISDRASIDKLCEAFSDYTVARHRDGAIDWERLSGRLSRHNSGDAFIDSAISLYRMLNPPSMSSARHTAHDGRSVIEVDGVERDGELIKVRGSALVADGAISAKVPERDAVPVEIDTKWAARGRWFVEIPLNARSVEIWPSGSDDPDKLVKMDLDYLE